MESSENPARTSHRDVFLPYLEACWLLAAIVVPCSFNPLLSFGAFQPFKGLLLNLLAALAAIFGFSSLLLERRATRTATSDGRPSRSRGVVFLIAIILASVAITMFTSVDPRSAFFGAYETGMGILSLASVITLGVAAAMFLRQPAQVDRLLMAILLPGVALGLYGVVQRSGLDPLGAPGLKVGRVSATEGNPIFLGAYLSLCLVVTVWHSVRAAQNTARGWKRTITLVGGTAAALCLLSGLVLTGSRGPALASGAALAVGGLVFLAQRRRFLVARLSVALLVLGALSIAFVGLRQRAGSASSLSCLPQTFRSVVDPNHPTQEARFDYWRGAPKLLFSEHPLRYPGGGEDGFHAFRPLLGYGPETLPLVMPQLAGTRDPGARIENHLHNLSWDFAYAFGIPVMLLLWIALYHLLRRTCGRTLGRVSSSRYWLFLAGGATLGTLCAAALSIGYAVPAAAVGAWGGMLAVLGFEYPRFSDNEEGPPFSEAVAIALFTAFLIHTSFAFPTPGTLLAFALLLGLLHSPALRVAEHTSVSFPENDPLEAPNVWLVTLTAFAFAGGFLHFLSLEGTTWQQSAARAFCGGNKSLWFQSVPFTVILPLFGIFLLLQIGRSSRPWKLLRCLGMIGGLLGAVLVGTFAHLRALGNLPAATLSGDAVSVRIDHQADHESAFATTLLLCVVPLAFGLYARGQSTRSLTRKWLPGFAAVAAIFVVSNLGAVSFIRERCASGMMTALARCGNLTGAIQAGEFCLRLNPRATPDRILLSELLISNRGKNDRLEDFRLRMNRVSDVLEAGTRQLPFAPLWYRLGKHQLRWAMIEPEAERKKLLFSQARETLGSSVLLDPYRDEVVFENHLLTVSHPLDTLGEKEREHPPLSGVPEYQSDTAMDVYAEKALKEGIPAIASLYAERSLAFADRAESFRRKAGGYEGAPYFNIEYTRGKLLQRTGSLETAANHLRLAAGSGHADAWKAEELLVQVSLGLGDRAAAREHGKRAVDLAPAAMKRTAAVMAEEALQK